MSQGLNAGVKTQLLTNKQIKQLYAIMITASFDAAQDMLAHFL